MATIEIPKYNKSLKAFSSVIQVCAIFGSLSLVIGVIWMANSLSEGDFSSLSLTLSLAYGGSGLIGLAIAGAFLRHTAKVIVEGLGGTIEIETTDNEVVTSEMQPSSEYSPSGISSSSPKVSTKKLSQGQYDAWVTSGKPDLAKFGGTSQDDFFEWLSKNKR
jgi:hypothetical protein